MKAHRTARVAEVIREVAAEAILFELRDPRVQGVTVTRAEVAGDLQHCKVFVSVMGTEREQKLTMHGLQSAAGFVQTKLAKRLTSRYVPHVTFVLDDGIKKSIAIAKLLADEKAKSGGVADGADNAEDDGAETDDDLEDTDDVDDIADTTPRADADGGPATR
ncbi:MAG: 30S ribosome-binding factor RbfA [Fimbriiglobus sp.]